MNHLISIVYYSGLEDLRATLSSIFPTDLKVRAVVLDVSEGNDAALLEEDFPVVVIWDPRNAGFSWGHQRTFDLYGATSDSFICLNPDILFLKDSLGRLTTHLEQDHGVFYALQLMAPGEPALYSVHHQLSLKEAAGRWLGVGRRRLRAPLSTFVEQVHSTGTIEQIPSNLAGGGALIAMKSKLWRETGGLDPDFFLFGEDREFGHRLARAGVPTFLCGDAPIIHGGGFRTSGPSAQSSTESVVSEEIYWKKEVHRSTRILWIIQVVGITVRLLRATLKGDRSGLATWGPTLRYRLTNPSAGSGPRHTDGHRVPVRLNGRRGC